jgi:hypothetical protein
MAYFKLITFGGLAPQLSPRLLKDNLAQTAEDVNLESGRLVPITDNSQTLVLDDANRTSIYKYTDSPERWLEFDEDVDVVPGPIAGDTNDTVYWTGQSYPRMGRSSVIVGVAPFPSSYYRLGIPAPTTAPTVAVNSPNYFTSTVSTVNGDSGLTVNTSTTGNHGLAVGDYVTLANFSATGGIAATDINGDFKVTSVPTATTFVVATNGSATSNATSSAVAQGVATNGPTDALPDYSTSYVYTFVSAYGEEGPPSAASTVVTTDDNQTITISGLETTSSKTNVNFGAGAVKRIYRSNTGTNTTAFQFVAEVSMATTSYSDTSDNVDLEEIIPSTYWIAPPDDDTTLYPDGPMKGLTALPNGVFAGFTGKRICFSEPFLPHAWPVVYRITLEDNIVAIGAAGNGLIVTTEGSPYLIAGTDPQSMSAIKIEAAQACLSKRSLVDMGPYVLYAGPDGLVAAAGTDVRIITEGLISPTQWQEEYYPSTLKGFLWKGRYVGFYYTGSAYKGFIFDPRGGEATLTSLSFSTEVRGGFTDPDDNELYIIVDDDIKKFQGGSTNQTFTWKSKEFVPPKPTSMGFAKVDAESYPVTIKVYGDGSVIYDATISTSGSVYSVTGTTPSFSATTIYEPIVRLPASVHRTYAIEVSSANTVNEICIGESIDELRAI